MTTSIAAVNNGIRRADRHCSIGLYYIEFLDIGSLLTVNMLLDEAGCYSHGIGPGMDFFNNDRTDFSYSIT